MTLASLNKNTWCIVGVILEVSAACGRTNVPVAPPTIDVAPGTVVLGCNRWPNGYSTLRAGLCLAIAFPQRVPVPGFNADLHLIDHRAFADCVRAGVCHEPDRDWFPTEAETTTTDTSALPIAVTWKQAVAYCQWRKRELPTIAEWERLARGDSEQMYPWGDDSPTCERGPAIQDGEFDVPTFCPLGPPGTYVGRSPYGADGMFGWNGEWTNEAPGELSRFRHDPIFETALKTDRYTTFDWHKVDVKRGDQHSEAWKDTRVVKGSWMNATNGGNAEASLGSLHVFRCVSSAVVRSSSGT